MVVSLVASYLNLCESCFNDGYNLDCCGIAAKFAAEVVVFVVLYDSND